MNIGDTLAPKSDQLDFDDFLAGERTFTVAGVKAGPSADQPVEILLQEFPRPWRPSKSMRRVLVAAWNADASTYVGKRMTLFGDPTVKFGGQAVGGIRIAALSHIDKPLTVSLTVTRAKRAPFVVQPLPDAPPADDRAAKAITALTNATSLPELDKLWARVVSGGLDSIPAVKGAFDARAKELAASQ
jgi:hypothetical protein